MNGLPLPQLPAAEQITDIDPLKILTDRYTQMVKQVGVQFDQADQLLSRDTDNKLRMLDREYQIELDAMKRKYESVPKSQRDEQYFQRANQDWIQLNKKYALADERTRGRIRPDLEESNAKRQQTLQQLQQDFENRKIRMDQTKRIAEKYGWPQEYLLKEMYALAGHDVPVTAFKPPDPIERLIQLNMARADAEKQGDMGAVKALDAQIAAARTQVAGVAPDVAKAAGKATAFQRAGAKFTRKRGPEEPGTLAEGIRQIKNETTGTQKPKYRQNKTTGEKQVSYDGGQTWQTMNGK